MLELERAQVDLSKRIMILSPPETKEECWKRVPIHPRTCPDPSKEVLDGPILMSGKMFYLRDKKGVRDLELESFKNCWPRACEALGLDRPWPHLICRGTWRSNARRSGMRYDIEMNIMGHSSRMKSVHERYG